jgi:hypothetical protein
MTVARNEREETTMWTRNQEWAEAVTAAVQKPVRRFLQLDGWLQDYPDGLLNPDADGHVVTAGLSLDLRKSDWPVRVQIHEHAAREDVLALLGKITRWLESDWDGLTQGWVRPQAPADGEVF